LILPQDAFERALAETLEQRTQQPILWNHRLDSFETIGEQVKASVEELTGTSTGYIVPHWETVVRKRFDLRGRFLLGADGYHSLVRQRLAVETVRTTERELFGAYEFVTDDEPHDEVRVVLDVGSTSVLWPLPGNKCRWNFQLVHTEMPDFPEKERRALRLSDEATDSRIRTFVEGLARKRAPWFKLSIKEVTWCSEVAFEHFCVKDFGRGQCWLAGDAAHQSGPVGVQSMNAGFSEASGLAKAFAKSLQAQGGAELLERFSREQISRWQQLLGLAGGVKAHASANPWVKDRAQRIFSHLPATDGSLEKLASQLQLEAA